MSEMKSKEEFGDELRPEPAALPPDDPSSVITGLVGDRPVFRLDGVAAPEVPTIVEARNLEKLSGIMVWALKTLDEAGIPPGAVLGLAAGAGLKMSGIAGEKADDPKEGDAQTRTVSKVKVLVSSFAPSGGGVNHLPVKNAWDAASKSAAGAPMAVFWQNPSTAGCEVAFVDVTEVAGLRGGLFQCETIVSQGAGFLSLMHEQGKVGASFGPAMKFLTGEGAPSAPPQFCIDGNRVSAEQHAAGRPSPFSGAALAAGLTGTGAGLMLPSGRVNCNIASMDSELAKAEGILRDWNDENEPGLRSAARRRGMMKADGVIAKALGEISGARRDLAVLKSTGQQAVGIAFGGHRDAARFTEALAGGLDAKAAPGVSAGSELAFGQALRAGA